MSLINRSIKRLFLKRLFSSHSKNARGLHSFCGRHRTTKARIPIGPITRAPTCTLSPTKRLSIGYVFAFFFFLFFSIACRSPYTRGFVSHAQLITPELRSLIRRKRPHTLWPYTLLQRRHSIDDAGHRVSETCTACGKLALTVKS